MLDWMWDDVDCFCWVCFWWLEIDKSPSSIYVLALIWLGARMDVGMNTSISMSNEFCFLKISLRVRLRAMTCKVSHLSFVRVTKIHWATCWFQWIHSHHDHEIFVAPLTKSPTVQTPAHPTMISTLSKLPRLVFRHEDEFMSGWIKSKKTHTRMNFRQLKMTDLSLHQYNLRNPTSVRPSCCGCH